MPGSSEAVVHAEVSAAAARDTGHHGGLAILTDRRRLARRSLRAATYEGMAAAIFGGCTGGSILTGWALYLGCSLPLAALIGASGQLGVLLQFPSAWCTSMFGVRATAIWTFAISRQTPLTLVLLPFLAMSREAKQVVLIAVTIFTALLASVGGNAVLVWHGDLVPERFRGRYFGLRDALFTISAMISSMVAGIVLDRYKASGSVGGGLAGITAVA